MNPYAPDHPPVVRLLLIDDDRALCELLVEYFRTLDFAVDVAHFGDQGLEKALSGNYSLAILDVMLPIMNGFDVLRSLRAKSRLPVLMLTARGEDVDRIVGLEIGADDYLPKPFNPRELAARVNAILRRAGASHSGPSAAPIVVGDTEMRPTSRTVRCAGRDVDLTGTEFALLEVLLRSAGNVVAREELCRTVLNRALQPFDRAIDMHVSNVRKKLGRTAGGDDRIRAVRGAGYAYVVVPGLPAAQPQTHTG